MNSGSGATAEMMAELLTCDLRLKKLLSSMRSLVCGGRPGYNAAWTEREREREFRGGLNAAKCTFEFNQVHHVASGVCWWAASQETTTVL